MFFRRVLLFQFFFSFFSILFKRIVFRRCSTTNFFSHFSFLSVSGYEWVGWRNDTPSMLGRPVEITFEFDYSRNFTAIHLHMNNYFTKDVQVRWIFEFSLETINRSYLHSRETLLFRFVFIYFAAKKLLYSMFPVPVIKSKYSNIHYDIYDDRSMHNSQ